MEIFRRSVYKVGRGRQICIPHQIVKSMGLKPGDYIYSYQDQSNNLIYSWDKGPNIPFGHYKIVRPAKRNETLITVPRIWLKFHGLDSGNKIDIHMGEDSFIIKKISEDENGENKE